MPEIEKELQIKKRIEYNDLKKYSNRRIKAREKSGSEIINDFRAAGD
jgi:hypothetical protein